MQVHDKSDSSNSSASEKDNPGPPDSGVPEEIENLTKDADSEKEEAYLSEEQYKNIQTKRRSDFKLHVYLASISGLWLGFAFYAIAAFSWLYHLLAPDRFTFMPVENIDTLQNLLFGTIVGGLIGQLARKIFSD
jgi:hypothetical protein